MHISELRLAGFKSFVDPTKAPIAPGLTGVVGPNGCGKSNLLEAVRWVMGSASAKSMRAEDMDDVIFAGSAGRPAREHAEVTLVLNDAADAAGGVFAGADTLEVTRRIRRGLGSTYRINGKEVRAKDVQLLFADAATGANSPALVRQGQVSDLIAAKPENRRRIIEEAAGIAGLHARRHEADLKLRSAETNLSRLDEILAEIDAQAASLRKQARQAERYRTLAETMRQTEALLLHRRWSEAREAAAASAEDLRAAERLVAESAARASEAQRAAETAREALPALREEEAIAGAILRRLEGVRVGLERDLADAEAALARADADALRAREDAARSEAQILDSDAAMTRLAAERAELGEDTVSDLETLQASAVEADAARAEADALLEARASERAAAAARADALRQAADAARTRLDRAKARREAVNAQHAALPDLDTLARERAEALTAARAAQEESAAHRKALAALEEALKHRESADEKAWSALRAADSTMREIEAEIRGLDKLTPPEAAKFPPVLAALDVADGYERALAAALGDDLEAALHEEAPLRWAGAKPRAITWPDGVEPLAHHVKAPPALAARLALCGVVEDGAALIAGLGPGVRLVSKAGALWRWDGFVRRADAALPSAARLEHKNRLRAARKELSAAKTRCDAAKTAHESARAARQQAETALRDARAQAPRLAARAAQAAQNEERLGAMLTRAEERRAELDAMRAQAELEAQEAEAAFAAHADDSAPALIDLAPLRADAERARTEAARARAALEGAKREAAAKAARRAAITHEEAQWKARAEAAQALLNAAEKAAEAAHAARTEAIEKPEAARAALAKLGEEADAAEARRKSASDEAARGETAAREADAAARAAEGAHAAAREARASAQARGESAAQRLADIAAQAHEATGRAPEDLIGLAGALITAPLARAPLADLEKRLDRLRAERDAGGPVNLRAEEELAETEARASSLRAERDDVAQGVAKLRGAITRLNNEGRARLMKAFEIVDANFAKLFATLFEGGQAALKLTESGDPLAAGLEIFAQPPGKKLSALSLMSGGEQALTATALIFAVFLANPAPLCVLDEVDAPLDDANVDRFCRLLDEMRRLTATRFMVITHNPVTMSRMDRLYGVTMPEQGVSQLVSVDLGAARAMAGV